MARELDNAAPTIFAPTSTARADTRLWADAYGEHAVPELVPSAESGDSGEEGEEGEGEGKGEDIDAYEVFGTYRQYVASGEWRGWSWMGLTTDAGPRLLRSGDPVG
jgi:hypothetical protein